MGWRRVVIVVREAFLSVPENGYFGNGCTQFYVGPRREVFRREEMPRI
jgi:hypothetical protein